METFRVNKLGRTYTPGISLSVDMRMHIVDSIKLAIMEAVDTISIEDMKGYYEATSYLFV